MTGLIVSADLDLRVVALSIYFIVIAAMVLAVVIVKTVEHRRHGNEAYRDRVQTILDEVLPREDEPEKWRANREEQRQ